MLKESRKKTLRKLKKMAIGFKIISNMMERLQKTYIGKSKARKLKLY
jgi:hypothetical protein